MMEKIFSVMFVIAIVAIAVMFVGLITMFLWNWIMPYLFGLPEVSFWMAVGINLLISIIFGSIKIKSNN